MKDTQLKKVYLSYEQMKMMHTMVRCAELRISRPGQVHKNLYEKLLKALGRVSQPVFIRELDLTPEELVLCRQYNTDYCSILANNDDEGEFQSAEIVQIYLLATSLQLSLTSRYY